MRLAARRFFYPGPIDFNPASDSRFIPLDGAALWFLRAPAQSVQQAADMIDVIMDTKRLVDDLADTRTSPQICGVACGSGSTKQNRLERFFGDLAQLGGPARCRLGPNRPVPFLQESRLPPAYAAPAYAEPPSDFHRLVPFLKKRDGAQTTLLKSPWTAGWSHVLPPGIEYRSFIMQESIIIQLILCRISYLTASPTETIDTCFLIASCTTLSNSSGLHPKGEGFSEISCV